ncbi:MAG TPA: hypothetical protein VJB66_01100 [Candidatus Nanoarchaeia archaeon]|nr:hypothetical protein [Candidatus Nanoarchaeia archaeon]
MTRATQHSRVKAVALAAGLTVLAPTAHYGNLALVDGSIPVEVQADGGSKTLDVPRYAWRTVLWGRCSVYARRTAEALFGLQYSEQAAWNRRYHDDIVRSGDNLSLESLANAEILKPGMIVGIKNPHTLLTEQTDERGLPAAYTHVVLYLGKDTQGNPLVAEQYGTRTLIRTERALRDAGLIPREIIAPKNVQ